MKQLPLRNALRVLLGELDLTTVVREEVLLVTTHEEAEALFQVVVYPVGDLVSPWELAYREQYLDDVAPAHKQDFDRLIDTITATVAPESWDAVGGPGAIEVLHTPSALVISQTGDTHERIIRLLTRMRRAKGREQQRLDKAAETDARRSKQFIKAYPLVKVGVESVEVGQLVDLLQVTLGPQVWKAGDQTLLRSVGNTIVVRHSAAVHRQVQRLLRELGVWTADKGESGAKGQQQGFGGGSGPTPGGAF